MVMFIFPIMEITVSVKINTAGIISTVAGTGVHGSGGDGGPATAANLSYPRGLFADTLGNVYFCDSDICVRKVNASGVISTICGNNRILGFAGDGGPATAANLFQPWDVTVDAAGYIYIADEGNARLRKIAPVVDISLDAANLYKSTGPNVVTVPNPSSGFFNLLINNNDAEIFSVSVFDVAGRQVQILQNRARQEAALKAGPGLYFIRVVTDKGMYSQKIIIN